MAANRNTRVTRRRRRAGLGTSKRSTAKKTTTVKSTTAGKKKTAAKPKTPQIVVSRIEFVEFGFALETDASSGRYGGYNSVNLKEARLFKVSDKVFTLQAPCGEEYKLNIDRLKKVIEEADKMNVTGKLPAAVDT
jgi:hypothetical protein